MIVPKVEILLSAVKEISKMVWRRAGEGEAAAHSVAGDTPGASSREESEGRAVP